MNTYTYFIFISVFVFITSCSKDRDIMIVNIDNLPISNTIKVDSFIIEEFFNPYRMYIINDYIVFNTASTGNKHLFYQYNKNTGKFKGKYGYYGRGHDEVYHLNPNYLYKKDSSIFVNTNYFQESEYLVNENGFKLIDNINIITDKIFLTFKKIHNNKFLAAYDKIEQEYVMVETGGNHIKHTNIGEYPNYDNDQLKTHEKAMFYGKNIALLSNNIYAFYKKIPLIRKYSSDMQLIKEVQIGNTYIFNREHNRNMRSFALVSTNLNNIYSPFYNNDKYEIIVFNTDLQPIARYDLLPDNVKGFCVDDEYIYIYIYKDSENYIIIEKYKISH